MLIRQRHYQSISTNCKLVNRHSQAKRLSEDDENDFNAMYNGIVNDAFQLRHSDELALAIEFDEILFTIV